MTDEVKDLQKQLDDMQKSLNDALAQNELLSKDNTDIKAKNTEAEKHRKAKEKEAKAAIEEAARKSGDVEALDKSWAEKYKALEQSSGDATTSLNKVINSLTVEAEAMSLANALALDGSADVIRPHIESRLAMEIVDGKPAIRVLKDGKPSALTLDDLKTEISGNAAFAPIIKGSSANGAGPAGSDGNAPHNTTMKRDKFAMLSQVEKNKFLVKEHGKLID